MDVIHPDDKVSFRQSKYDSKGAHTKIDLEYKIITSSGNSRYVYTRNELILDDEDVPSQSFGTVQDITERGKTELHEKSRILETSELSDIDQVSATMKACHDLGVRFALDDFGTGYSSLTHLRRLPAHLIEIDQSFVRDMLKNTDELAIIEGVIGLAKAFQRNAIAEGVETIDHGVALLKLGCELAQGYGIARPMPAGNIPKWLSSWKADDAWQNTKSCRD
jgi:sensor c-di-GMP phosphodiesterase-like protein